MKKYLLLLFLPLVFSCSNDDGEDICTQLYKEHQQAIEDAGDDEQAIDEADNAYILGMMENDCN